MSIISVVCVKGAIIVSSDCRGTHSRLIKGEWITKTEDRLPKTFLLELINVSISYCGNIKVYGKLFHEFIKEFADKEITSQDTVLSVAEKICNIPISEREDTRFIVCGHINCIPVVCFIRNGYKIILNQNKQGLIYDKFTFGMDEDVNKFYDKKYADSIDFENLSFEKGIDLAEELVEYAIKNEESCGYPMSTLITGYVNSKWIRKNFVGQNVNL